MKNMQNRVFLDTNIVLDFIDSSRAFHKNAIELFEKLIDEKSEIYICEISIVNIFYILRKNRNLQEIFIDFTDSLKDFVNIVGFGKEVLNLAIKEYKYSHLDIEDLLQAYTAFINKCDLIYTNDINFPKVGDIKIINF